MSVFRVVFGSVSWKSIKLLMLYSIFLIALTSATVGIRDVYNFLLDGVPVTFTVGVIFFPLTFVISNVIQEEYDISLANSVVFCALFTDLLFVSMLFIIAFFGMRSDYKAIFEPLPYIWLISFCSILLSCFVNNYVFKKIRKLCRKGFLGAFMSILASSTIAELLLPLFALPFLLHGLKDARIVSAILLALAYKICVTVILSLIASVVKGIFDYRKERVEYMQRKRSGMANKIGVTRE